MKMIERIMRFFSSIGDGLLGLFIKIMVVLIILVIIVAAIQGAITHWVLVLSMLVGLLLSPLFYRELGKRIKIEFPEFFSWGLTDVIETLVPNEETYTSLREQLAQKREAAKKVASTMEAKADALSVTANAYIQERKLRIGSKSEIKGPVTSRMKKAMMMQLDDEEDSVIRELHDQKQEINWDNYL
jgi:hypothetical protein